MAEIVIFDCDGMLVDSDRISLRIQAEWISALGLETTYEDCVRDFLGLGVPATLQILTERLDRPLPSGWEKELDAAVREDFDASFSLSRAWLRLSRRSTCPPASLPAAVRRRCVSPSVSPAYGIASSGESTRQTKSGGASRRPICSCTRHRAWPRRRSGASSGVCSAECGWLRLL